MWLDMLHDGLGRAVRLPILVARGERDGPVVGITAAVHGNEVNGVNTIHRLLHHIDTQKLKGTLVGVPVVNIGGFLLHQRRTDDGSDLNHLFPGKPHGREAEVLAWRFTERVVRRLDVLLDLHTASFGRVNCLYIRADMNNPRTAQMARLMRPEIIVHNPPADGTLRGCAASMGIPAITVEIGSAHRFQREYVKKTRTGLRAVLSELGMVAKRQVAVTDPPVVCSRSSWMFTDHGGLLEILPRVTQHVSAGEDVAVLRDVFGDETRRYVAPEDGVIIGHSVDPVADTGARILHLGVVAPPHVFGGEG
ncbi:MAG: succinylglutamate desuccinylase/aspartoacylase family protein [Deltaproteobacteria bacterium]|nr:MAG: succinylglutamate desuccinylase/aspartoacylase family protein [Deltaproteobacteria bacterium]